MGKNSSSPIQTAEAKPLSPPTLSDFSRKKSDRIQMPQLIYEPPKNRGFARTGQTGDQNIRCAGHRISLFFQYSSRHLSLPLEINPGVLEHWSIGVMQK
jgi:hypothetical protein